MKRAKNKLGKEIWNLAAKIRDSGKRIDATTVLEMAADADIHISWQNVDRVLDALSSHVATGHYYMSNSLISFVGSYLANRKIWNILDPDAGIGSLLTGIAENSSADRAVGINRTSEEHEIAMNLGSDTRFQWLIADPQIRLGELEESFDLVVSAPLVGQGRHYVALQVSPNDSKGKLPRGRSEVILTLNSCLKLSETGEGIFILPDDHFTLSKSPIGIIEDYGFYIHSILSLGSSGVFSEASFDHALVFISREKPNYWFVGQLSDNERRNHEVLQNLKERKDGGSLGLGKLFTPWEYRGFRRHREAEKAYELASERDLKPITLDEIVSEINFVKSGSKQAFEEKANTVYLPTIGTSDAVTSQDRCSIKLHNYVQLLINPEVADPEFVASFFNTRLGRMIRSQAETGLHIPKISKTGLKGLVLYLPSLETQMRTIRAETRIRNHQNALEELSEQIWERPDNLESTLQRLQQLLPNEERFTDWLDSLPFPLASILWSYYADENDPRQQYQQLLHFFEALAEFMTTVLLSGFINDQKRFKEERKVLNKTLRTEGLSWAMSTFGTWVSAYGRLARVLRQNLSEGKQQSSDKQLFMTTDQRILEMLGSKKLVQILQEANKLRNDWSGHTGAVSDREAEMRHQALRGKLSQVREVFGKAWERYMLVLPGDMRYRNGQFTCSAKKVMGNRTPFENKRLEVDQPLEENTLHLVSATDRQALELLPLVKVMPSPQTEQNACYFFNRRQSEGIRFISYHFEDDPEVISNFEDTEDTIELLTEDSGFDPK